MPAKQKTVERITVERALLGVAKSARIKAFRRNRPIAVSIEGKAYLIYPNGTQRAITKKLLQELKNGQA